MRRKTKIVCTLGPASSDEKTIRELIIAGMDVARFNFSHGAHADHLEKFHTLKKVREDLVLFVAAMLDTKGPEIRLGKFAEGSVELKADGIFTLTTDDVVGTGGQTLLTGGVVQGGGGGGEARNREGGASFTKKADTYLLFFVQLLDKYLVFVDKQNALAALGQQSADKSSAGLAGTDHRDAHLI